MSKSRQHSSHVSSGVFRQLERTVLCVLQIQRSVVDVVVFDEQVITTFGEIPEFGIYAGAG
jgi:hypothetical protein